MDKESFSFDSPELAKEDIANEIINHFHKYKPDTLLLVKMLWQLNETFIDIAVQLDETKALISQLPDKQDDIDKAHAYQDKMDNVIDALAGIENTLKKQE